jgi:hypothetical protein
MGRELETRVTIDGVTRSGVRVHLDSNALQRGRGALGGPDGRQFVIPVAARSKRPGAAAASTPPVRATTTRSTKKKAQKKASKRLLRRQ